MLNTGIEKVVVVAESAEPDCLNFAVNLGNKYGVGEKYVLSLYLAQKIDAFSLQQGKD